MIRFEKATQRNTPCHYLHIGGISLTLSYETIVAARLPTQRIRRHNEWGRTTGRHLKDTNTYDYRILEEAEFNSAVELAIQSEYLSKLTTRLAGTDKAINLAELIDS